MNKKESEEWQKEMKKALNKAMEDRAKEQIKNDFPELYNPKQGKGGKCE